MNTIPIHSQIIVVGAGPVGALMALNLKKQGHDVLLVEARPQGTEATDKRTLALSYNSLQAFLSAGVPLDAAQLTTINEVHVSQQNAFGRTLLRASDMKLPLLGKVVDYKHLLQACESALSIHNVPVLWQSPVKKITSLSQMAQVELNNGHSISCRWLILAEGGDLTNHLHGIKRHEYHYEQTALVSTVRFKTPTTGIAFERFCDVGPMALLPYYDAYRLIWTRSPQDVAALKQMDQQQLITAFTSAFGSRLGEVASIDDIASFPLVLKQLNQVHSNRVICIGNAAQTMHPVAAQGLNLGVRDAQVLSQAFQQDHALHDEYLGKKYGIKRSFDAHSIVGFTHSLVTVFDHPSTPLKLARGTVMAALDIFPNGRKKFTKHLIYGL